MALDLIRPQKTIRSLRKFLKKAPKLPTSEEVHHLRTHARRLQAMLEALALHRKRGPRRMLRTLGRVSRRAGKIRDMDVLLAYVSTMQIAAERECLVRLLEYLGAERYRQTARLHSLVQQHKAALRRGLKSTWKRIERLISRVGRDESLGRKTAPAHVLAYALELSRELESPATLNRANLHPYRLKIKQLRYVLQMVDDAEEREFVSKLGAVKDAIGKWHDWEKLTALAADALDHGPRCKLLMELKRASDQNFKRALSLAQQVRRENLHSDGRTKKSAKKR